MYAAGWIADAPAFKWIGAGVAAGGVLAYLAFATAFGGEAFRLVAAIGIIAARADADLRRPGRAPEPQVTGRLTAPTRGNGRTRPARDPCGRCADRPAVVLHLVVLLRVEDVFDFPAEHLQGGEQLLVVGRRAVAILLGLQHQQRRVDLQALIGEVLHSCRMPRPERGSPRLCRRL